MPRTYLRSSTLASRPARRLGSSLDALAWLLTSNPTVSRTILGVLRSGVGLMSISTVGSAVMFALAVVFAASLTSALSVIAGGYRPVWFRRQAMSVLAQYIAEREGGLEDGLLPDRILRRKAELVRVLEADEQTDDIALIDLTIGRLCFDNRVLSAEFEAARDQQLGLSMTYVVKRLDRLADESETALLKSGMAIIAQEVRVLRVKAARQLLPMAFARAMKLQDRHSRIILPCTALILVAYVIGRWFISSPATLATVNDVAATIVTVVVALWLAHVVAPLYTAALPLDASTSEKIRFACRLGVFGLFALIASISFGLGWVQHLQAEVAPSIDRLFESVLSTQAGRVCLVVGGIAMVALLGRRLPGRCLAYLRFEPSMRRRADFVLTLLVYAPIVCLFGLFLVCTALRIDPIPFIQRSIVVIWVFWGAAAVVGVAGYVGDFVGHRRRIRMYARASLPARVEPPTALVVICWLSPWILWLFVTTAAEMVGNPLLEQAAALAMLSAWPGMIIAPFGALIHGWIQHRRSKAEDLMLAGQFDTLQVVAARAQSITRPDPDLLI